MISRRDFLKGAGAAALAVAATGMLAGCAGANVPPVTPDPAPAPNPSTGSTNALGQAIPVADGVTVTVTGKRYNYYTMEGEGDNFGFIALKVSVKNEGSKAFAVKSDAFKLIQTDYKPRVQYPLNVSAYSNGNTRTAEGLEFMLSKFVGRDDPAMDEVPAGQGYDLGNPGTELAAYLGFLTNVNEAEGTATLQYVVGDKVYKINF